MATVTAALAVSGPVTNVVRCESANALERVRGADVGLALWGRPSKISLCLALDALLKLTPFTEVSQGTPGAAARALMGRLPPTSRALGSDIEFLSGLFLRITGESEVRLRLEHVADDSCRCHHVDAVRLRMLCTYAGQGTEWLDTDSRMHRMDVMQVGIFKGTGFPDNAPRVLHRSPPVASLPKHRRSRILICIDQPGVF